MEDNYSLFRRREAQQEATLRNRPVCFYCGEPVQDDHYFDIYGAVVCQDCLEDHFRKDIAE